MRIEEVAADADVSPALLYYHFENRAGLVRAALEHASELAPSTVLRERRADGNGYERLEAALLRELDDESGVRDAAVVWGPDLSPRARRGMFQQAQGGARLPRLTNNQEDERE
jgi:AcrR family transcriptional regulator